MSSSPETPDTLNAARLASINQKILGDSGAPDQFATVTLPGGDKVRTGTIATLLHNIRLYDRSKDVAERKTLEEEIRLTIPTLRKVGMFDLFSAEEWVGEGREGVSEGRTLVGKMALEGK